MIKHTEGVPLLGCEKHYKPIRFPSYWLNMIYPRDLFTGWVVSGLLWSIETKTSTTTSTSDKREDTLGNTSEPQTHGITLNTSLKLYTFSFPCSLRVSYLVGDGESRSQANVLVDAAAPLRLTHPPNRSQT